MEQQIRFASARDGTRLAYAIHGSGPLLVRAPTWLTHLEYDWESPIWQPWLEAFGRRWTTLRYDERGCGLSDWDTQDFSLEAWVEDLETVVDATGFGRFALFGMSQGAQVAIAYAASHPERVSHLVTLGGYLTGWDRPDLNPEDRAEMEALITLMGLGWGREDPSFRRVWTSSFVPDGDELLMRSYDELMRRTTSSENAVRFERAFGHADVAEIAPLVRAPTLIIHVDDDHVVGPRWGPRIAAAIPGARFVQFPGNNHIIRPDEPAWLRFLDLVDDFVRTDSPVVETRASLSTANADLSARELDVLRLVAEGWSNAEIAAELALSVRTIERHLSNIYVKFGLGGKAARAAAAARLARDTRLPRLTPAPRV